MALLVSLGIVQRKGLHTKHVASQEPFKLPTAIIHQRENTAKRSLHLTTYPSPDNIEANTTVPLGFRSSLFLSLSQRNISPRPEVAQISHRKVDTQPHFCSHHNKCHVPAIWEENRSKSADVFLVMAIQDTVSAELTPV
jgi:hypothetical protein